MSEKKLVEIICSACGAETLLLRRPKYDGFVRVGETLACSSCGHEYEGEEEVPFKEQVAPRVFSDADRPVAVEVFDKDEARICRHCVHYTINPFTQWCGHHQREVQATDSCDQFERKKEEEDASPI